MPPRSVEQRHALKAEASKSILGKDKVQLDDDETTGDGVFPFPFKLGSQVCGVVVDLGSELGYVQIQGGDAQFDKIHTNPTYGGYEYKNISKEQSCMLYGRPTVWYIVPRPEKDP